VTLVLSLNTPDAICMSVDYRVTDRDKGTVLDPFAVESLVIQTSDQPGGPVAIIGYSGLARLWGGMPMGRWLRETLRGECQPLSDLMAHLLRQLNRKIAHFNQVLVINVVMASGSGDERYFGGFSNTKDRVTAEPQFECNISRVDIPYLWASGSACEKATVPRHVNSVKALASSSGVSAADHMALLAKINREVAEADPNGPVSPYCYVMYVGGDTNWTVTGKVFTQSGEMPPPFSMPLIWCGIDVSNPAEQIQKAFQNRAHPTLDEDQIRRNLDRRP
jgi:hypothetical protein